MTKRRKKTTVSLQTKTYNSLSNIKKTRIQNRSQLQLSNSDKRTRARERCRLLNCAKTTAAAADEARSCFVRVMRQLKRRMTTRRKDGRRGREGREDTRKVATVAACQFACRKSRRDVAIYVAYSKCFSCQWVVRGEKHSRALENIVRLFY